MVLSALTPKEIILSQHVIIERTVFESGGVDFMVDGPGWLLSSTVVRLQACDERPKSRGTECRRVCAGGAVNVENGAADTDDVLMT